MKKETVTIDGSRGEGGGQILRSSLSLSMCLGIPVQIDNIRAGRKKPGLLRQHLTCVRAAQSICNAKVTGDELGSKQVSFHPDSIKPGEYRFAIGTAGSTGLVFQTLLPALLLASNHSTVFFEGGTHNQQAPSHEYLTQCFLQSLEKIGVEVECKLLRYGFYPNGGGEWVARVNPIATSVRIKLLERGQLKSRKATTFTTGIPQHVSQRELKTIAKKLKWNERELVEVDAKALGSGNLISLQLNYENCTELFEEVAQIGVRAEKVAANAIRKLKRYVDSSAVVGEHLADQLLLPMALFSGGSFVTHSLSQHVKTNIEVINRFIDDAISVSETDIDTNKIVIKGLNLVSVSTD